MATTTGYIDYTEQGSTPATPSTTHWRLYFKSDGLYYVDDAGTPSGPLPTSALSNPMTTAQDLIVGGASGAPSRLAVGTPGQVLTVSAGTAVAWADASSATNLLGVQRYQPGTDSTIYTLTTTPALADSTNLVVTFTAPASGKVIVRFTGVVNDAATSDHYWALWEGGSLVGSNTRRVGGSSQWFTQTASFYLTGISAGSHTYQWAAYKTTGTALLQGGPLYGACLMEVWQA